MNEEIRVLIENLKQYTLQYAAEHGVVPDSRGFVQCLFPDHDDRDPSMHWWEENNIFWCFSCNRVCDIFTLANIFEGKPLAGPDFLEDNVFYLAEKFGQPYLHLRKTLTPEEMERQMYFRTMKLFSDYVVSHANKEYLANREIEEKTAKTLSIGSVDNYQNCINYLVNAGCQREILNNIGIMANRVNENQLIMIIKDEYGRPMSFVSRHMHFVKGESKFPKYTNGNETIIFNKSRMLYCWSDIKKQYNTLEKLLVVEGYIDAVSAYQKGYRNVVALGSASFTDEHISLLEKENRIKNVAFALDNDETGRKRMFSIVERLKNQKTTNEYQFAIYKEQGKDLDEILKKFDKKVSLANIFELVSMFDYEIRCLKENYGDNIDESSMFDHFIGIISKTQRPKEREEQAKSLAKYLPSYSYKTILAEIEMILSEEKINYKKDIVAVLDKAYKEATNNPEYALEIIGSLSDDIENVQAKYDRTQQGVFESSVSRFKESEKYKMNSDLYQIKFGIPWLDDLNLKPGNSVIMAGLPNTGKSTVFQCLMHNIAVNSPNGVIIYIATDDSEEMIYDNLTAQLSGLPREYCGNPYFDSQFGLNSSQLPEAQQYFDKYCKSREFIERLIVNKKLIILDVKQKIDNWNGFKKAISKIVADKELENKYKIMVVDSVNKISVDGIKDENQTAGFLSAEIKKLNERDRILGFLNFELNKMRDNSKLSQFALSGSKRMFYDCNVLGFIYNPTRNLQEFEGTEYETKMKWQLQINEFNSIPQPVIVTIQSKSKAGNNSMNARPYFYKLNEFTSKLTPIPLASEEHQHYLKIWRDEWNNLYTSNYSKA